MLKAVSAHLRYRVMNVAKSTIVDATVIDEPSYTNAGTASETPEQFPKGPES